MSSVLGMWAKEAQLKDLRQEAERSRRTASIAKRRPTRRSAWSRTVGFALVDVGLRIAAAQPEPVRAHRALSRPAAETAGAGRRP
jgi:hypothetical protein